MNDNGGEQTAEHRELREDGVVARLDLVLAEAHVGGSVRTGGLSVRDVRERNVSERPVAGKVLPEGSYGDIAEAAQERPTDVGAGARCEAGSRARGFEPRPADVDQRLQRICEWDVVVNRRHRERDAPDEMLDLSEFAAPCGCEVRVGGRFLAEMQQATPSQPPFPRPRLVGIDRVAPALGIERRPSTSGSRSSQPVIPTASPRQTLIRLPVLLTGWVSGSSRSCRSTSGWFPDSSPSCRGTSGRSLPTRCHPDRRPPAGPE